MVRACVRACVRASVEKVQKYSKADFDHRRSSCLFDEEGIGLVYLLNGLRRRRVDVILMNLKLKPGVRMYLSTRGSSSYLLRVFYAIKSSPILLGTDCLSVARRREHPVVFFAACYILFLSRYSSSSSSSSMSKIGWEMVIVILIGKQERERFRFRFRFRCIS